MSHQAEQQRSKIIRWWNFLQNVARKGSGPEQKCKKVQTKSYRCENRTLEQKEITSLALVNLLDYRINYDMNSSHVHLLCFLMEIF